MSIGGGTETTDAIDPEVPVILERVVMALGLASALAALVLEVGKHLMPAMRLGQGFGF